MFIQQPRVSRDSKEWDIVSYCVHAISNFLVMTWKEHGFAALFAVFDVLRSRYCYCKKEGSIELEREIKRGLVMLLLLLLQKREKYGVRVCPSRVGGTHFVRGNRNNSITSYWEFSGDLCGDLHGEGSAFC